jgi:hypothetical protein
LLDFFPPGRYRVRMVEPSKKLKFSTIFIAAIAGLIGLGVFFFHWSADFQRLPRGRFTSQPWKARADISPRSSA